MSEARRHTPLYRPGVVRSAPDGRLFSPTFDKNHEAITATLSRLMAGKRGFALEIGSGCGQQVCDLAAAMPDIVWIPSDPDPMHRRSIAAWIAHTGMGEEGANRVVDPVDIDARSAWDAVTQSAPLQAVFAANVIHISPWTVTEGVVANAGRLLAPGGLLAFYGPFREGGAHTAPSNASFDDGLRADNPEWGVRDLDDVAALAQTSGFCPAHIDRLPANNIIASFRLSDRTGSRIS